MGFIGNIVDIEHYKEGWSNKCQYIMPCIYIKSKHECDKALRISTNTEYDIYSCTMDIGDVFIRDKMPFSQSLKFEVATKIKSLTKSQIINYEKQLIEKFKEQTEIIK